MLASGNCFAVNPTGAPLNFSGIPVAYTRQSSSVSAGKRLGTNLEKFMSS